MERLDGWLFAAYLASEVMFVIVRLISVAVTPHACLVGAERIIGCMP
jgi:hypothetical protein